ncbi:MAG: DUF3575 domain-containing protein [Bacteroidales bacterium]|nr:DUF3575 domain-containing protein [Bacteroidales bacterium]
MTKKLTLLFVAIGIASMGLAQGVTWPVGTTVEAPASAFTAQTPPAFAIRTNLVYWATLTPNFGAEYGITNKITFSLNGGYNFLNLKGSTENNSKFVHWIAEPEVRYWTCERFNGHAFGVHGIYSKYNIGGYKIPLLFEKDFRYEGVAYGGGVSYNYHWMAGKSLGVEFTLGVGFVYLQYEKFPCGHCTEPINTFMKTYIGPTKLGINLIYVIK